MKTYLYKIRLKLIYALFLLNFCYSQSTEELKKFMETYDKIKVDQQANDVVKKGIESDSEFKDSPVKLLISPSEVSKYYEQKINSIRNELSKLNDLLILSDSLKPITSFGYNYFSKRDSVSYLDNNKISDNYILGFGDEIIISIWGQVEQYERKTIQRDGSIFVKNACET